MVSGSRRVAEATPSLAAVQSYTPAAATTTTTSYTEPAAVGASGEKAEGQGEAKQQQQKEQRAKASMVADDELYALPFVPPNWRRYAQDILVGVWELVLYVLVMLLAIMVEANARAFRSGESEGGGSAGRGIVVLHGTEWPCPWRASSSSGRRGLGARTRGDFGFGTRGPSHSGECSLAC